MSVLTSAKSALTGSVLGQVYKAVKNTETNYNLDLSKVPGLKTGALGAGDYSGIGSAINVYKNGGILSAVNNPGNVIGGYSSAGSGGSSSGSGGAAAPAGAFVSKNGKVQFANKDLQLAMQMINQQAADNNAWSAEQAQKQMDFQKMMSDSAHQREVADLQAAGLNPVLSAGGSGAQVTSGAMAQVDDSNTRLIGELAGLAIEAVQNTAVGVSGAMAAGNRSSSLFKNPYVNAFIKSGASVAGAIGARALLGAVGL